jgi:hypothetical protein
LIDVHILSEYPKVVVKFLKNVSKMFRNHDYPSNNGANQAMCNA